MFLELKTMKNIFLTGGAGFVGRTFHFACKDKFNILNPKSSELNLTDYFSLEKFIKSNKFDWIVHCAVKGGRRTRVDTEADFFNNIKSLDNILNFINDDCKLITFSSGAEIHKKDDFYGFSKKISTEIIKNKPNIKNLRIYNTFGELGMKDSFVYSTINKCLKNEDVIIWNDMLYDCFYVGDLINLVSELIDLNSNSYQEIDCVYSEKYKLSDIAKLIKNLTSSNSNIVINNFSSDSYVGKSNLNIELVGLKNGIYNIIKNIQNEKT